MRVRRHTHAPRELDELTADADASVETAEQISEPGADRADRRRPGRWARDLGLLVLGLLLVFGLGYGVSALWLSPAPLVTTDHSVPLVLELGPTAARERLGNLGFRVRVDGSQPSSTTPRGSVVWQDPAPGTVAPEGVLVTLILSAGPRPVPTPDLTGMPVSLAQTILDAAGLRVGTSDTLISEEDAGVILATRPTVGTLRDPGSTIDLVVSAGPRGAP